MPRSPLNLLAAGAAALSLLFVPASLAQSSANTHAGAIEAEFRGCDSAGWCRFRIEAGDALVRVRPDGVARMPDDGAAAIAVRNRLNALLSNMIHQAKHIVLHDLRKLDDGTFAALVTVTGVNVAADPVLMQLHEKADATPR
ncbi:MAG TPA: hypothetical protein VF523_17850 [Burkholderiales bacterium]